MHLRRGRKLGFEQIPGDVIVSLHDFTATATTKTYVIVIALGEIKVEIWIRRTKLFWRSTRPPSILDARKRRRCTQLQLLVIRNVDRAAAAHASGGRHRGASGKYHVHCAISVYKAPSCSVGDKVVEKAGGHTDISKRYRLHTRRKRTGFSKGKAGILVVHPDLIEFIPSPIIAEKKYVWSNFRISVKT